MNKQMKKMAVIAGAVAALASGAAMAESTYGYDNAVTPGVVVATAKLKITVNIPKLILLRVGSAGPATDEITFTATPNIQTAPGAAPVVGDSQPATWNGVAPTFAFAATPSAAVTAYLWHNNAALAQLTCSATTAFTGLTAADVTVTSVGSLAHPGANTACGTTVSSLARNTVLTSTWTFAVSAANVALAAAGADSEVVTYTATTL